jgi:hypothetical protein
VNKPTGDVTLTDEERRVLAQLEARTATDHHRRPLATIAAQVASIRARRYAGAGEMLLLLVGAAATFWTFATCQVVSLIGVGLQTLALWGIVSRHATRAHNTLRRWATAVAASR